MVEFGLDALAFEWSEQEQNEFIQRPQFMGRYKVSVLTHRPSRYYITFGGIRVERSPGLERKVESEFHEDAWANKHRACYDWLVALKNELDAPDLWASIGKETALPRAASSATLDNLPFTPAEQGLIGTKLDEIKAHLLQGQRFAAEEAETIEREFEYLRESSERLGRKDWLNTLLGALVGLAITLALDPAKARRILRLAGEVFQSLWGMAQGYLQ